LCCDVSGVPVEVYGEEGMLLIDELMADVRTVLVLAHHVRASLEWAWFPFAAERSGVSCAADAHAKAQIEYVEQILRGFGFKTFVIPYPGPSDISFKRLAAETSLGGMGRSFLFLHHEWGPWVHLRVLLTNARFGDKVRHSRIPCTGCKSCIESCPAQALSADAHDEEACTRYQQSLNARPATETGRRVKCEACARACPVAAPPREITIL
jgi:epoxyqueuosine reductase